ncbi:MULTISPECIES: alpha/beta fold hydrolase [unclassified Novosphingobium]|uniref:alpha/beta fold hydrolase n=1 Tax=unclassified Novosphingobium TaxID=2644732 RepID=UPI001796977F|nr:MULTISPECIES: alpha/beta hydrolase [unclassified Novosphingobium]MBB3356972.1 pimeloyl-ACP methyl ester carboxylesterase [Novosphingobium sp. BK256]MBB3373373.1 pimeloyl-ACP methyl ester carboxylesterase [Novosphingobium sp. BK280]MBB3377742.1 pimeloyl-ACP methyl ester carboxylesterase [Novosphingobium sp. BK258]MBB3418847.1 pimeloyl-ACP methyl ester carboxylesterase [Novosphingobium sp. BK267]MBB3450318.1 pimeloyl-ACP methyl ester carboxylesterase [Novosphingobium sp. BK352]
MGRQIKLLLIPGFMLDADLWTDLRPELDAMGDVIDVDTTRDTSIPAIAHRALIATDGPVVVVGFSMGGYVAREIAYQAPERVKGLLLVATSAAADAPHLMESRRSLGGQVAPFRRLSRRAIEKSLSQLCRTDAMIERVQRMSERLGPEVFARQSSIQRAGDAARLRDITCPTAILSAGADELRSLAESEALRDGIAGSVLTVVEGAGHLVPLEQPAAVIAALSALMMRLR